MEQAHRRPAPAVGARLSGIRSFPAVGGRLGRVFGIDFAGEPVPVEDRFGDHTVSRLLLEPGADGRDALGVEA
jgi:hypothetical protein